jgi:hypothetical protein
MAVGTLLFSVSMELSFAGSWVAPFGKLIEIVGVTGFFLTFFGGICAAILAGKAKR